MATISANKILGFDISPDASVGLALGLTSGILLVGGVWQKINNQTVGLIDNSTLFIDVDARGVAARSITTFRTSSNFLYQVVTAGGIVTSVIDWRTRGVWPDGATPTFSIGGTTLPAGTSVLNITGLPTSASGLATGDVWANAGVLTIV